MKLIYQILYSAILGFLICPIIADAANHNVGSTPVVQNLGGNSGSTWLFLDWWHMEHQDNVVIRQGKPKWIPEATYEDPTFDYLGFWPHV